MTTLHILSNPNKPTDINVTIDPFSSIIWNFIDNIQKYGYKTIHYGLSNSNVRGDHIECPDGTEQYNAFAGSHIKQIKSKNDLILCFYGTGNKLAADINSDLKIVEPSIGYRTNGVFAPYRVFTSYGHMHFFYGERGMLMNPSWFDEVIPNAFKVSEYRYQPVKEDYLLIFGRVIEEKGIHLAIQVAKHLNKKLVIAGPGSLEQLGYANLPANVEYVGMADREMRRELMANAKALLAPTYYVEPFGNMVVDALMSGTPVITTDWGGFLDTNPDKRTGFRCRSFADFVNAVENIDMINPLECHIFAEDNFSEAVVYKKFDNYLKKVIMNNFYHI
jgi:glycosyltransferase involved in cell wall biosynthesis